jgi:hypothetical protein
MAGIHWCEPQNWNLLDADEKVVYRHIAAALSAPTRRIKRGKRLADFTEILEALEVFVSMDEENKWKRCLVSGVCRLPFGIAVNTTQLKRLISKCKSTINASLRSIGFGTIITEAWAYASLISQIPCLKNNALDLKQWTIRVASHVLPQPINKPATQARHVESIVPPEDPAAITWDLCDFEHESIDDTSDSFQDFSD